MKCISYIIRNKRNNLLVLCLIACLSAVQGQSVAYYRGTDPVFNTAAQISSGLTVSDYITVQYGGFVNGVTYASGWTLRVRANGNFSNGSTSIAAQYVSISFSSAPSGPTGVAGRGYQTLSTSTAKQLITTTSAIQTPPMYFFEHKLNMRVTGGSHLTVGTGTYSGTLTLTLVDKNGITVATNNNVLASFVVNYNNSCSGATIATYASNQPTFTSYAQQMAGTTVTDALTVQYTPNAATCAGWSLKVRAAGNFVSGSNSVAPQYFSFRFNRVSNGLPSASDIGVTNNPVVLSNTDVSLISQSNGSFTANTGTEHKFDMIIQGGNHLLLPNGTYSGSLIVTLYNQSNQVVSSSTVTVSFAVNSTSNSYTVVFQNSADNIVMTFNTASDYTNGVSVTKTKGLKITGYNPYQVVIKTSAANLVSASSNTIPVSAVSLQATQSTSTTGGILVYSRALSTSDQILISNPMVDYTQQVVEYTLRYYTQAGDNRLSQPGGSYNTSVLFVVMPK
jgi:hypothetical protein